MDAHEHLPGCDGRHGKRQRCNGQPAEVAALPAGWELAPAPAFPRDRWTDAALALSKGIILTAIGAVVVFIAGIVLLFAALIALTIVFGPDPAPGLPKELYPPHSRKLMNKDVTDITGTEGNRFRLAVFASDRPLCEARDDIEANLRAEGWTVKPPAQGKCDVYATAPDPARHVSYFERESYYEYWVHFELPEFPIFVTIDHSSK